MNGSLKRVTGIVEDSKEADMSKRAKNQLRAKKWIGANKIYNIKHNSPFLSSTAPLIRRWPSTSRGRRTDPPQLNYSRT